MFSPMMDLLQNFNMTEAVSAEALSLFEEEFGVSLPKTYQDFLKLSNGGEGFLGEDAYLILWPLEELIQLNSAYQVGELAPGLFLFGSNGGGEAYGFDTMLGGMPIVEVPFVGMDRAYANTIASDFLKFLESLNNAE
jgi:hypothetical protein